LNTESRSLVAIVICVFFYFAYEYYLDAKYPDRKKKQVEPTAEVSGTMPGTPTPGATAVPGATPAVPGQPAPAALKPEDLVIATDVATFRFSQELGAIDGVILKNFQSDKSPDSPPMNILDTPLALQGTTDIKSLTPVVGGFNGERQGRKIKLWRDTPQLRIAQEFTVPETGYGADLKVSFTNIGNAAVDLTGGLLAYERIRPKKSSNVMGFLPGVVSERDQLVYSADGDTEWVDVEKFCKGDEDPIRGSGVPVSYLGLDRHYFLALIEPNAKTGSFRMEPLPQTDAGCPIAIIHYDAQGSLQPGDTVAMDYKLYFGPKDVAAMAAHDPRLESAMHLGFFDFIARPLLMVIEGFYKILGNWGVAIIVLTFLLKVLFYPLVRASSTSMHRMKKLNPQMTAIREKFKDDRTKQQQELMRFMSANKINPMKGCLPILPQIPVFFAFYQVLQTAIQLRHAPFMGWIQDLSAMDPYFVTPILMGGAMVVQQKLTPTTGMDKTQEKILMFMPIMFTAMMLTLPAGLTLYMLTNTVTGIAQQKWLYRRLDKLDAKVVGTKE
jgi:YidC/Oxa1 family membrane protein insertase